MAFLSVVSLSVVSLSVVSLLVATSGTAHAACDDPAALVDQVEGAVLDARFDDARATTDQAEAAFGCTGSADSTLLARLWIAEGAMDHIEGDTSGRDQAFASAQRLSPQTWTASLGDELKALWTTAATLDSGTGQLDIEGLGDGQVARVDGQPVTTPTQLDSGLYLVQADGQGGPPSFARIVLVPSDQTLVVRIENEGLGADLDQLTASDSVHAHGRAHKGRWAWFVGAGTAAALAGTSAYLATSQTTSMTDATSLTTLDQAYGRQRSFTYASFGLAGLAAAGVGVGIAW